MKKTISFLAVILVLTVILSGCRTGGTKPVESQGPVKIETVEIAAIKGPSAMGMVRLIQEINALSDRLNITFDIVPSPDIAGAGLVSGQYAIAALPTNMASILYNRTEGDLQLIAVNTLGTLFIVSRQDEQILSINDLKGKRVVTSGLGAVPEIILNHVLTSNGMDPGQDLRIEYKSEHSEVATLFSAGEADIVMLPQPFVTVVLQRNSDAEISVDMTKEWEKLTGGLSLPMGCIVARKDFIAKYPEETRVFLETYKETMDWVLENPSLAASGIVALDILPSEEIAGEALLNSNIVFYTADESKSMLQQFFRILHESNPASIGGKVPGDDFYHTP
ncbi:MAG: MqnA/MqnD/SBP family protein [Clostridia bacterium]